MANCLNCSKPVSEGSKFCDKECYKIWLNRDSYKQNCPDCGEVLVRDHGLECKNEECRVIRVENKNNRVIRATVM